MLDSPLHINITHSKWIYPLNLKYKNLLNNNPSNLSNKKLVVISNGFRYQFIKYKIISY